MQNTTDSGFFESTVVCNQKSENAVLFAIAASDSGIAALPTASIAVDSFVSQKADVVDLFINACHELNVADSFLHQPLLLKSRSWSSFH